jgi:hypothetical protein
MNNKVEIIKNLINDGGRFTSASFDALVEQKQLKRGNPLANKLITKDVTYIVSLNGNYAKMVNAQRVREGKEANFEAKLNWHEKVYDGVNGSIVKNRTKDDDKRYLMAVVNQATNHGYFVDGRKASQSEVEIIKQFKPKDNSAESQGLDKGIVIRTITIDNINRIKCGDEIIL